MENEMTRTNYQLIAIAETMQKFGGSFAKALALAMLHADTDNRQRIATAFPELMARYEVMHTRKVKEVAQ
jgi:hypothetical protein